MLKKPRSKTKTVAEKVDELLLHRNQSDSECDSEDEVTAPKVIDYDDEYELPSTQTTEFRKQNVKLLSEQNDKYKGKISCRKDYESDHSDNEEYYENSDSSDDQEEIEAFSGASKRRDKQNAQVFNSDREIEDDDAQEYKDSNDIGDSNSDMESDDEEEENVVISKINHEAELQKGVCVQNQLRIWERLLELRIQLQKVMNKTTQLPSLHDLRDVEKNDKFIEIKQSACHQTCLLLKNLLTLKNKLSTQFPEVEKNMKPYLKRPLSFIENTLEEPPLKQLSLHLEDGFKQFSSYRNDVLLKWDDRTKLLQPGAGNKKKNFNEEYDVIKKINNALINKSLLIKKSQQIKISTQKETQQESKTNPNIYDDSDFYHQQLRELIEYKTSTTSETNNMGVVTKQLVQLQKLRQKMKKQVDTKASKGRKLRYIVHNKLVNFMAPHDNYTWTGEAVGELSKSLFM